MLAAMTMIRYAQSSAEVRWPTGMKKLTVNNPQTVIATALQKRSRLVISFKSHMNATRNALPREIDNGTVETKLWK
jgi:hypothetical protein